MNTKKQHIGRKRVIFILGVLTLVYALLMPDRDLLWQGLVAILTNPTHLLTDFFAVGGLSATFANVAGHFFLAHYLMSRNERSNVNGLQIGAVGIFAGHAFFGTNLLNVLPLIGGMVLYATFTKQSFKLYTTVSLFATSMGPVVSYLAFHEGLSLRSGLTALAVGLGLGFIAPALAEEFLKFHHGLTLYNYGFTTGLITMFVVLLFPYVQLPIVSRLLVSETYHAYILGYWLLVIGVLLVFLLRHLLAAAAAYPALIKSTGRVPDDFVTKFGLYPTLLNMCLTGSLFLVSLLALGITLNGPILGGLLTILGFSAFGKHPLNTLPVGLGVLLACYLLGQPLTDWRFALPLLFSTGLSPIAGFYGWFYGLVAGFLHYNLSSTVLGLHQGLSLYNNGFSTGFVAAVLAPLIDSFQDHKPLWIKGKTHVNGKK